MSARILDDSALDDVTGGGTTPSEAYFVRCDRSTMSAHSGRDAFELTEFTLKGENSTNVGSATNKDEDRPLVILNPDGP